MSHPRFQALENITFFFVRSRLSSSSILSLTVVVPFLLYHLQSSILNSSRSQFSILTVERDFGSIRLDASATTWSERDFEHDFEEEEKGQYHHGWGDWDFNGSVVDVHE